jgi:putative tricarboxylic transport membrane protein
MGPLRVPIVAACLALSLAAVTAEVSAQEPYYKGKRLTVLINFAAGGPADIEGRIFAKHLAKHIDGQPNLVVQNMDGAGGLIGAQYLGEIAPKDGSVVGALTGTAWIYASDPERWRVDFRSYEFVARQASTTVHFVRTDVPPGIKEPTDIVKAKGLIAGGLSAARLALQRGEIHMFSESPPSCRSVVVPQLVAPGIAIPVFYDEVIDPPPPQKQLEGLTIPAFPQLYRSIKGAPPSGQLWEAYRSLFEMSSVLLRVVALPPGTPRPDYDALSKAITRLGDDKEFAAESMKVMEFIPEYETAPDMSQKVRAMLVASPEMRTYINDYMRNVPKR